MKTSFGSITNVWQISLLALVLSVAADAQAFQTEMPAAAGDAKQLTYFELLEAGLISAKNSPKTFQELAAGGMRTRCKRRRRRGAMIRPNG